MAANPSPLPGMVHIVEGAALPANPTFNDCFPPESGRRGRWRRMSACDPNRSCVHPSPVIPIQHQELIHQAGFALGQMTSPLNSGQPMARAEAFAASVGGHCLSHRAAVIR
jgi:hypothetical protein